MNDGYAAVARPTWRQRIFRKLGWRFHLGDEPEGVDGWSGWVKTEIMLKFSVLDRIRLLFSGHLRVYSIVHSDAPSPLRCKSRVDYWIVPPGEK